MRIDDFVELSYNYGIEQIKENNDSWKEFLRLNGRIYQFEFNNVVVIYNQNKYAALLADFDTWNNVGRYVNKGSSAIKIYPSRVFTNRANIRHLFDLSQTSGREVANNWVMSDDIKNEFIKFYSLDNSDVNFSLRAFTSAIIDDIITDRYGDSIAHYSVQAKEFISKSISYLVFNRCRILDIDEYDFSDISAYNSQNIAQFGNVINNVSQEVLHDIFEDVVIITENIKNRRDNYGQGLETGVQVQRGRTWLLNTGISGRIRTNGLQNQPMGNRLGGLDGGELSDGVRRSSGPSSITSESADGRSINQSRGGDDASERTNEKEEWNRQDSGLHAAPSTDQLREFSSRGNNQEGNSRSEETVSFETAKRLINEFAVYEYGSLADFSDLSKVDLAYTTISNDDSEKEYDLQVSADLINYSIKYYIDNTYVKEKKYDSLDALIDNELNVLDFGILTNEYFSADIWTRFSQNTQDEEVATNEAAFSFDAFEEIKELHKGDQLIDENGNVFVMQEDKTLEHSPYFYFGAIKEKNDNYNIEYYDEPDSIEYSDIREIRFGSGSVYYLSDDEIANMRGIKLLESFILEGRKGYKDNIDGFSYTDIMMRVKSYIDNTINEFAPDLQVVDFALYGSRARGYYDEYSDLDIVLFIKTPSDNYIREDYLFDILHGVRGNFEEEDEEQLTINGITVDINPKIIHNYAEIGEYIESAERYMEESAKDKIKADSEAIDINSELTFTEQDTRTSESSVSEEIAEIIEQTKVDETADISEPTAVETFHQASLFDEGFWEGFSSSGESSLPESSFATNLISDSVIDEIIKTDGRRATSYYKWWGRVGIYEKYREGLSPDEMADFLKKEYGEVAKGFTIDGEFYAMYCDSNGMFFGKGKSARDGFVRKLSWEEVEQRTRNLVQNGFYMNVSEVELVDDFARQGLAEEIEFLFRDLEDPYPSEILLKHKGGFPDNVSEIKELLLSKDYINTVIKETEKIVNREYTPRFSRLADRKSKELLTNLSFYLRDKKEFITRNDVILLDESFITQELIDMSLRKTGRKLEIYEWFQIEHSTKDSVDFVKHNYGIGGQGGDWWIDHINSRSVKLTVGSLIGDNVTLDLSYTDVVKRIKYLIKKDEYLSDKEKKEYEDKMAARVAFLDGLEVGNIYKNPNSYSGSDYDWVIEVDYDNQKIKYIGVDLTDDFSFDIENNDRVYRHIWESDFKYFPDRNYEYVKNAKDFGGLELVPFETSYPSDNDWIVKLSSGIDISNVESDYISSEVDESYNENIDESVAPDDLKQTEAEEMEFLKDTIDNSINVPKLNYRIDLGDLPDSVGPKGRFKRNIDAIKTLKKIESENRLATAEEQKVLSLYVGWGGLSEAFDESNSNWKSEFFELKNLLSDTEYSSARASVNTAFYTDPAVINAVSEAVKNMGFKGGNILEPSCAIGNFFGTLDEEILNNSNVYGVEIDDVSGRIARQLYQNVDISICGYEDTKFSDNFFDLAIGNVPFGQYKVFDKDYRDLNFNIHDYFFAKTLDKVRPGGIIAFITTIGTLDKKSDIVRKYIGERAELLGAIRLPDITFKDNAGTKAASDIIFLQKRNYRTIEEPDWLDILPNEDNILINRYYLENPNMMLGKMAVDNRFGDKSFKTCVSIEGRNLISDLNDAITNLPSDIYADYKIVSDDDVIEDVIPADPEVRNYTYTVIGDDIYFRTNSVMTKEDFKGKDKDRVKACIQISDFVRKVMNIQLNGCSDEELSAALKGLNEAYDTFVKEYGYFHDRKNHSLFQKDDGYNVLEALEMENDDNKTYHKSPFFSERTIKNAETVQSVDNAVDALNCSINDFGRVNLRYMASLYDKNVEQLKKELLDNNIISLDNDSLTDEEIKMYSLINELKGVIYLNPQLYNEENIFVGWETADEYLSGNVRRKLEVAKTAAEDNSDLFATNVSALTSVIPEWIDATNIEVRLGTTWIENSDIEKFIYELFDVPYRLQRVENGGYWNNNNNKVIVEKDDIKSGDYYISNKSSFYSEKLSTTYGTNRLNGLEIIERLLNLKIVTVYDYYEEDGKKKRIINNKETMVARDKAELIKQEFKDWIFATPERREKYEKYYNENFNNVHLRTYNGDYLTFPGMTPTIKLRPHQKNAVSHILLGGNTLLAHAVGAGKSFEMFAAVMEQRRLGIANKPVIVVPKSIINQTANEFLRLYPTANLLVANTKNFAKKDRMRFLSRASTGDYDCIIMSHEQFKEIPISKERMISLLNKEFDLYTEVLQDLAEKDRQSGGKKWSIKRMERERQNIETRIKKLEDEISEGKIDLFTFEETGIDSIFVDEAHNYKNRGVFTKMSNISGISNTDAKLAQDMYFKTQYLNEKHSGRGVVFATGTPISNSMVEMYVMQTYLQNDRLIDRGVAAFDNWATSFGEVTQSLDLSVEGNGYRLRNKFNKFVNVPELLTMFHEFADVQTADMLNLPDVPTMRGGKAIIVESQVDDFTKMYMDSIVERAEALRNKQVTDPRVDNFLKITGEARLLGTDARLLDASAPDNPDGKLNKAAENIYNEYVMANDNGIIGTQLVFSDIGTPSPNKFNVYDELKKKLIEKGIPEDEIAFIHDAKTDVQRQKLFDNTQSGKIKVLFGSTSKLGTGVNVQHHLVALHHLDCPWRPSDIEQREGRGLRQGNENSEVAIYRYVTVGTFDAYLWSVVENKQKFINQVMRGSITNRNMQDIDDTELGFAEIKAVASGNPKIKRKMELDMELQKLNMLKNAFQKNKYSLQDKIMKEYPREITRCKEQIELLKADIITRDSELKKNPDFEITICGTGEVFTERKDAGQKIIELARTVKTDGEKRFIAKYKGFEVYVECSIMGFTGLSRHLIIKGESTSKTDKFSADYLGIITQIENKVKSLDKRLENTEYNLEQAYKNKAQAELEFEKPFEHEDKLAAVKKELNEINTELDLDNIQDSQTFAIDENGNTLDEDLEANKNKTL